MEQQNIGIGKNNPKVIESLSSMSRKKVCTKNTTKRRDIKVNLNIYNQT